MSNFQIGDKVLRKSDRDGYHMGTIVDMDAKRATVAWPSNRIGGNGTQKSRLLLTALVPTTEEICHQRAKEAAAARREENARRWPYRCQRGHSANAEDGRTGKPCRYCGGALSVMPGREQYA